MVLEDKSLDFSNIVRLHASRRRQCDGFQPELALAFGRTNVDVRRLAPFVGVKVESERSDA
jgi:hypothetical protein